MGAAEPADHAILLGSAKQLFLDDYLIAEQKTLYAAFTQPRNSRVQFFQGGKAKTDVLTGPADSSKERKYRLELDCSRQGRLSKTITISRNLVTGDQDRAVSSSRLPRCDGLTLTLFGINFTIWAV